MPTSHVKPLTGNAGDFSGIVLKAAARGDSVAVRQYLEVNPAWLNREGPHGRTLLWEAVYKGRTGLVTELIEMGAHVDPVGSYYTPMLVELSALAVARWAGHHDLVRVLEQHGAEDDLYAACHRGALEAINRFLATDAKAVNRPAREAPAHPRMGWHPVHYAVAGRQPGAVRLLAGFGAEIDPHLPLLLDWADRHPPTKRSLRDVTGTNSARRHAPAPRTRSAPSVPVVDRPDWLGFPPLVDACRGNHNAPDDPTRVRALLARGANVRITDHKGKTALHRASQAGFLRITMLLLEHEADLEAVDARGCTPIFDAALHGRTETLRLLIERGADLHRIEARGETPLFAAARGARFDTLEALLDAGADPGHRNARGKSAAEIVSGSRHMTEDRRRILERLARM